MVRAVEMSLAPGRQVPRRGGRLVLEGGDPAIPLDRVPYFTHDLKQVALIGGSAVVLLIVSALIFIPLVLR